MHFVCAQCVQLTGHTDIEVTPISQPNSLSRFVVCKADIKEEIAREQAVLTQVLLWELRH